MITFAEFVERWESRRVEWTRLKVTVDGGTIASEIVADLRDVELNVSSETLSPTEAAAATGFHPESVCRMVREGRVTNYGTPHRPRVKLAELPKKAGRRVATNGPTGSSSDPIAREAVAGRIGRAAS